MFVLIGGEILIDKEFNGRSNKMITHILRKTTL